MKIKKRKPRTALHRKVNKMLSECGNEFELRDKLNLNTI